MRVDVDNVSGNTVDRIIAVVVVAVRVIIVATVVGHSLLLLILLRVICRWGCIRQRGEELNKTKKKKLDEK